jgi:two-component system, NtrC family, sensor histidine kinase HydH
MGAASERLVASAVAPLARRLAWVTGLRLLFLTVLLGLLGLLNFTSKLQTTFTGQTAFITLAAGFALTAIYATWLRGGRKLQRLVVLQLSIDPILWTVIVYLSGAASSGATSLYGLSCVTGALLIGFRGAALSMVLGASCFGALLAGLGGGWIPAPPDQAVDVYHLTTQELSYSALVNTLGMGVVALLAGSLAERLRMAGGELVLAEERAKQAESMAALGRLAAGLAHEIRNPLGSISGSIQLLKTNRALSPEDQRLCTIIVREASRLNDLVTDMMDLARPRQPRLVCVDAAATAREVVSLAAQSGRAVSDVGIVYEGLETAPIAADPAHLRQLIWNLVRNAVQASHAGEQVQVRVQPARGNRKRRVELSVSDRGVGLDAEARDRIFDAFFTTRAQGTGVGLAVVKRIADDHGFSIEVESEAGHGAIFRIDLGSLLEVPIGAPPRREETWTLFPPRY